MSSQPFSLSPFRLPSIPPQSPPSRPITLGGTISRSGNTLSLDYQLSGDLTQIALPYPVDQPRRQDTLWQSTCFEFFLGLPQQPRYWEFNLSPSHHWNVYRFNDYRQGMQTEKAIADLTWDDQRQADQYRLQLDVDLAPLGLTDQRLQVSITTVICTVDNALSYWALAHSGPEPDFHRRDSFRLQL